MRQAHNRAGVCDVPGSWYCVGQYPPALRPLIDRRVDFAQLEDFNKKSDGNADAYVAQYMARMEGRATGPGGGYAAPEYFEVDDEEEEYYDDDARARRSRLARCGWWWWRPGSPLVNRWSVPK